MIIVFFESKRKKNEKYVIKVEHSILCWTINLQMNNELNFRLNYLLYIECTILQGDLIKKHFFLS